MEVVTKCAHCGAQIHFEQGVEILKCEYCDSLNVIESKPIDVQNPGITLDDITKKLGAVFRTRELKKPDLTFAANHVLSNNILGSNTQGGKLWITDREVFFKPHKFNIGDLSKRYVKISDIIGYEKGPLTQLTLKTKKGDMMLAVWKKDAIINAIEQKKRNLAAIGELNSDNTTSETSSATSLGSYNSKNNVNIKIPSGIKRYRWPIILLLIAMLIRCAGKW